MKSKNSLILKIQNYWVDNKIYTIVGIISLLLLTSIFGSWLSKKENRLGIAYINIASDETFVANQYSRYIKALDLNPKKETIELFTNLYLTEDTLNPFFKDAYISSLKITAAIEAKRIDMAIFNEEAFAIMTKSGYLLDLNEFIATSPLKEKKNLSDRLVSLAAEDNPKSIASGIDISEFMNTEDFNISNRVYLGIIANTGHPGEISDFLEVVATCLDNEK